MLMCWMHSSVTPLTVTLMQGKVTSRRRVLFSALKAKKAERKHEKMKRKNKPEKSIIKSQTTQNVAASGASVIGALAFLRNMWPDLMPWGAEHDATLAAVGAGVLVPLISRIIAKIRK